MSLENIATAMQRVKSAFMRRPEAGIHDDAPATASWDGDVKVITRHADGTQLVTDMPRELGGSGEYVTPGWLFRAGLASCAATSIALAAAAKGLRLTELEVTASSRSDARGLLGMSEPSGDPVYAGPFDMQLHVRIRADGVSAELLREMVEGSLRHSPIPNAVSHATPLVLHIDVDAH
jgi:uncharacterized OsmC-like protein